jgi:alpha-mannosidase
MNFPKPIQQTITALFTIVIIFMGSSNLFSQEENNGQKEITVHMVGHAHIDPVYRWRWNDVRDRNLDFTFNNALDMLDQYPELTFSQSQLLFYESVQKNSPELFKRITHQISEDRWHVVGGQWIEPDEVLTSGESMIRQFLVAHDYYNRELGIDSISIAWSPDAFTGHPNTLPKIYSGCGIDYYVFSRSAPEDKRVFWWEGRDESRVLAYKIPDHYMPDYNNLAGTVKNWSEITNHKEVMMTFGKGDHGGGPQPQQIERLNRIDRSNDSINIVFGTSLDYFDNLPSGNSDWPVYKSELRKGFTGCYTSQAKIKRKNRKLENRLLTAEKFATIGCMYHRKPFFPRQDFLSAWKILLFNQFHDIIPGTMVSLAVNDVMKDYQTLDALTSDLLNYGLELIGSRIDTRMDGIPLVVYNPHSWEVTDYTRTNIRFVEKPENFKIIDQDKNSIPYQINSWSDDGLTANITIHAKEIPPTGYKTYEVLKEPHNRIDTELIVKSNRIENEYYVVEWDESGLTSIYSKTMDREILNGHGNALKLLREKAGESSSWGLSVSEEQIDLKSMHSPRIIKESPLQATVQWKDRSRSSKFTRKMTIKTGSPRIDFQLKVDWHESNKLLRVSFPIDIEDGNAYYEQPYGYIKRELNDKEKPAQKWVDLSNDQYGAALLNNGKNGFMINESSINMSVVRGPQGMDPRMDEGNHSFGYALVVHEGDWKDANIPQKALEFNQTLKSMQELHHIGKTNAWYTGNTTLPREHSFFGVDNDHVILSSIKVKRDEYNPAKVILRVFETEGKSGNVKVNLPTEPKNITECNHLEEPISPKSKINKDEDGFSFKIGHNQIRTFLVEFM